MKKTDEALLYHSHPTPGKLAIVPTKPCESARDLSLAYSPGVAKPCLEIASNPEDVYRYTGKGNLVAVITNGTAVLGLGDIGPKAAKPVMEGKAVLFKTFADIDVFDLELDCSSTAQFIETVAALAPTFGGINLEDIKAPECFEIEETLKKRLDIPVFHDDQHGTAIIAGAALLNALEVAGKPISEISLVVNGAGAAAIACCHLLLKIGLRKDQIILCDSKGVINQARFDEVNGHKRDFISSTKASTLEQALKGADVFFGLSVAGALTPTMLSSMAKNPIVFAMANPDPEIDYPTAKKTRPDAIIATGRSDYPNQVNNVLGFPFVFRGALDVQARGINEEMKLAAVYALAKLAKEPVPDSVRQAYGNASFSYGPEYLIPKPFDPRVLYYVAPAVAKAAMESGLARKEIDLEEYEFKLKSKQHHGRVVLRSFQTLAKQSTGKRIAFSEGAHPKVLKAAAMVREEGVAVPVLMGERAKIESIAKGLDIDASQFEIIDPLKDERYPSFVEAYFRSKSRSGITFADAQRAMRNEHLYACSLLLHEDVDGLISGVDENYPHMVKPILEIIGLRAEAKRAAGLYLVSIKEQLYFFADTTLNLKVDSRVLADIALMAADFARSMNITPRVAMLSFSNFGSVDHPMAKMVRDAKDLVLEVAPELEIDGEMQADAAVVEEILREKFPFSRLSSPANILVFPDMQSGNISYKLLQRLGGARVIGPVLLGLNAPAYVMQRHAGVDEIFNMAIIASAQAAMKK